MRKAKRLLSLFTAAAIAMSTFVSYIAPASAAVGDTVTVLENTLKDATTITDTDAYTWGADVAGIVTADGIKITNENSAANNYEGKSFVTFTNAVGDETHQVDITYNGYSVRDKGQAATISTMSYYDADGNFLFGIGESSGGWAYSASLTYADTATTTATVALPAAHIAKGSGSQAAINVVYTADGGMVTVDGGTPYAFVGGSIKDIKLSVSGGQDYSRYTCISNYKMTTTEVEAVVSADYTINYVYDETTVKTETGSNVVGTVVNGVSPIKDAEGNKYYAADEATLTMTLVDGENVLNVPVRAAEEYAVTITQNLGGTVVDYKTDVALEGEAYSCYWPAYVKDAEGTWYKADDTTSYGISVAAASEAITKEVAYTAVESTIVAFLEGENATKTGGSTTVVSNSAFSDGKGQNVMNTATVALAFEFTAPVTGTYTLSAPIYNSNSKSRGYAVYVDDATFTTTAGATAEVASATASSFSFDVDLKAGEHTVYYALTYSLTPDIDYLLVELKEAAAQYDVTVNETENGTATTAFATSAEGDTVKVLATPDKNYAVDTITVTAADGTDVAVTDGAFTMPAQAVTIDVTFKYDPVKYDVTVNPEITNGTATTDVEKAAAGATVTITATPADGYRVASYEVKAADDTAVEVTGNTFVMPEQAVTVSVIFELTPVSAVTVEAAENGTVTADAETAAEGSTVTITATPAEGYKLKAITVTAADGSAVAVTKGKFTMPAQAVTVTATFREKFEDQTVSNIAATDLTYVNDGAADDNFSTAGVVYANYSKLSGGTMQASDGAADVALMKFDLSEYVGAIKTAKLTFTATCTAAGKNSQLNVASTDTNWEASTVTWNTKPGNVVRLAQPGYANDAGETFTVDLSDYVSDDADGIVSFALYTSTARQQAITNVSMEIYISDVETTTVTVNNVVGEDIIKTYTVEDLDVGSSYTADEAQLGYKLVGDKYYFPAETATTTIDALALEGNVLNIEFVASEEKIAVYEDFANLADKWSFTEGKSGSVVLGNGIIKLTQIGATSGEANEYGYYYSDVKDLGTSALTKGTLVIEWSSDVEGNKNRKNAFEIVDSSNNVVFGLVSQAGKGSSDTLAAGVTYQVGAKATDASTNIASSGWASGNSGTYTITLDFDFTGETGKVSGSIKGGVANADITIAETEVTATNIAKLVASDVYSAAPQSLYSVKVVDDSPVVPTTYAVTVAEATNGTVTVDKATAAEGETVTITATAAEGYEVDTITVKDADEADVTVTGNTFTMPAKAVTVTVTFKEASGETPVDPTTYAVTVAEATNGTVTVDKATAEAGATVTITATAAEGYEIDTIAVADADGAAVAVENNAFVMPAKAVTVTVTFSKVEVPVDPTAVIDFTNRTLTYETKGSSTVFEVTDAKTAGATALEAAGAGNVLKLGSSANGGSKMLGYKADFAKEGANTVVYGGNVTMSFKLEPMQVRTDKDATIELAFADINGNKILPITVNTGATPGLKVNGTAATGIAYGNYYVVTYTMDFAAKTASVKIDTADGVTNCLNIENVAITAENLTQLYRADSDWLYGYCAIDDIAVEAEEIGVPIFYTITINAERYAKLTTSTGLVYYADVNGKIEIPLQKPGTAFDYTLSKVGYENVTGTVEALTGDFEDSKAMTKSSEDIIFIESEFGNATEAYVSPDAMRNDSISIGSVALPDMSEITVNMTFNGFGANSGQQKTWALVSDAGALVGLQFSDNGIYAWTGWTGSTSWNQSSDIGTYTLGERLGDLTTGDLTFKFVVDKVGKAVTVSYGDVSKSLTYSVEATALTGMQTGLYRYMGGINTTEIVIAKPDENYLAINGVSGVAKVSGQTIEREYALSQTVIIADETFTWSVADAEGNAIEGVTIENGVLKVADTATPGVAVITCVGSSSAEKTATFNVTIGDFQQVTLVIDGPQSYDVTDTAGQYTVVSAKDSFGDEIKDIAPAVVWTSSDETVVAVDAATGASTVVGAGSAVITATLTNGTAVSTATIPVTVDTYYIVADATGDSTVVDITNLVDDAAITGYQVTTIKDGAIVNQTVVAKADVVGGTSTSTAKAAGEKIVATYDANGAITSITATAVAEGEAVDLTATSNTKVFFWNSLNGMAPVAVESVTTPATITVDTTGADKVEVAPVYETKVGTLLAIPAATYNITVTANNGARSDVYANEQMLINNLNQGSDSWTPGRIIAASTDYLVEDIVIAEGYVKFKMYDDKSNGSTVTNVKFAKVPDGVARKQRIYAIGDSLVANYYGAAPEGQEGLVRTGMGQVLDKFIVDSVGVTNLGNSGAEAVGMLGAAFTNVKASAKAGDVVIWESGYNDRTYSTVEKMKAAITEAYEYCVANDIDFFVVNPNASSHDYNASVVWASHIRDLATATGMPLIDLSQKSYDFLNGMYADVADVHTLLRTYYNNANDTLHSSYNAANCWASIVAQGLYDAGFEEVVDTTYSYTFNDGIQDITVKVVEAAAEATPAE